MGGEILDGGTFCYEMEILNYVYIIVAFATEIWIEIWM